MADMETIYAGDTITIRLQITDPETGTGFYNLANATSIVVAIASTNSSEGVLIKTFSAASVMVGAASNGTVELKLLPADTDTITICNGVLQVRVIENDGDEYTVLYQPITIVKAITTQLASEGGESLIDG